MRKIKIIALAFLLLSPVTAQAGKPANLKKCQICHGKDLHGKKKNPPIAGLSFDDLMASLTTNVPKKMNRIASKLTHEQKEEVSRYISSLGGLNESR